jgi:uncharacterized 2Fe-2S/4Fe-4S cluster protein (DUF4445 family)
MTILSETIKIDFEPIGRRAVIEKGKTLLEGAQTAGVQIVSLCGGVGACDSCKVRLMQGELEPPTLTEEDLFCQEEINSGYRLACQAIPKNDVKIHIPPGSLTTPQRLQIEGQEISIGTDAVVFPFDLEIEPPSLKDLRADSKRIIDRLNENDVLACNFSIYILNQITEKVREMGWKVRLAIRHMNVDEDSVAGKREKDCAEVVAVLPYGKKIFGLAVDIGTTKIASYLLDLSTGETLTKRGAMNPQISYGEDVVSRIAYAIENIDGRDILQQRLIETVNLLIEEMCVELDISATQIVEAVVVGNTAIHHLFAGLPVKQLGLLPYVPSESNAMNIPAHELGLNISTGAYVYMPPNIAGYVGADHMAMILSTGVPEAEDIVVALDIGTNTEITLAVDGIMRSCSCASGPAFEGAHIREGMRAAPGAIERVHIHEDCIRTLTIGDQLPVGICGSGILDTVAEMYRVGIVDNRGALQDSDERVAGTGKGREFVLVPAEQTGHSRDIKLSRADVNEIQLAKAAIRSGIDILLFQAGIDVSKIDRFIVAGAFGTYLDIESAIAIGMFPDIGLEKYTQVGNAAGTGARQMLISTEFRNAASTYAEQLEYVELTTHPDFQKVFLKRMYF